MVLLIILGTSIICSLIIFIIDENSTRNYIRSLKLENIENEIKKCDEQINQLKKSNDFKEIDYWLERKELLEYYLNLKEKIN